MQKKSVLSLSLVLVFLMALFGSAAAAEEVNENIVDIVAADGRFNTLHTAIVAAGLADTLASADNSFTVFAPTDTAFAALEAASPGITASLLADPQGALSQVLLYHVVNGELDSAAVVGSSTLTSLQGESLNVSASDAGAFINDSQIVIVDVPAKNGIIHVIDAVLVPQAVANASTTTAPAMEESADSAPVEESASAEEAAPADDQMDMAAAAPTQTIAEIAVANGSFNTLLAALDAAGLADTFAQPGDYTVFAPTDAAFANIPQATLEALLADPEGELTNILLFHVVGDSLSRDQIATTEFITTLDGRPLTVNTDDGNIVDINGATVLIYNIPASNGIIHVIDTVLIP